MNEYDDEEEAKWPEGYVWHWLDEFLEIEGKVVDWDYIAKVLKAVKPHWGRNTSAIAGALDGAWLDDESRPIRSALESEIYDNTEALSPGEKIFQLDGTGLRAIVAAIEVLRRSDARKAARDAVLQAERDAYVAATTQAEREAESDRQVDEANRLFAEAQAAQTALAERQAAAAPKPKRARAKRSLTVVTER